MQPAPTCRRCGAALSGPGAACARCLLELGVAPPPVPDDESAPSSASVHMVPPSVDELRAIFPDLEIESLIGRGGMGAVFRARQKKLQRDVALKVLPRELSADRAFADRFLREARALARLSHPNIVAVYDYGETGGVCWLILEYVDGLNLRGVLRAGTMEPRQALAIVRELCEALQYAHDEGVVHRDIKPENVLVDRRGHAKVADFGLAKLVGAQHDANLTREGQVMGTPHYMAPEQIEHPRDVDHRADIYALGVVFYEMLTGSLPRGNFEPPSRRVQVDVRLDEIVLKALEHEPSRRYQHAVDVKTDVDQVGDGARNSDAPVEAYDIDARVGSAGVRVVASRSLFRGWPAFVLVLVSWIALGASWNLGPFAFGIAAVVIVLLGGLLVHGRLLDQPELDAARLAEHPAKRSSRLVGAAVTGVMGLVVVAIGHLAHWERGIHAWVPAWRGTDGLLENLRTNVWSLMPADAGGQSIVQPRLAVSHSSTTASAGEGLPIPGLALIVIGLFALGIAVYYAARVDPRGPARKSAQSIASELGMSIALGLVVLWVGVPLAALRGESRLASVHLESRIDVPVDEALGRLRIAFVRAGLDVDVEQIAQVVDERSGAHYADVLVLRGASQSPFDRWSTTWSGAARRTPQVWISAVRARDARSTEVRLNAGLYPPDSPESRAAADVLRSIEKWASAPQ